MDRKRQGEIALKLVKYVLNKRGIVLPPGYLQEFGNVAKKIGVSVKELKQFFNPLMQELLYGDLDDNQKNADKQSEKKAPSTAINV